MELEVCEIIENEGTRWGEILGLQGVWARYQTLEGMLAGSINITVMGRNYLCIQLVTIKEILEQGKRLDIPLSFEVIGSA